MCLNPATIKVHGLQRQVSCRVCEQCKANRVRDWVGRCIAESKDSPATSVVTLTYGSTETVDGARTTQTLSAQVLTYSDVQKWLKRLRNQLGLPFRYVLCGEYGGLKGRAHWHVILFWQVYKPDFFAGHLRQRWWQDPFWSKHPDSEGGYVFWDDFSPETATYICKYILKTELEDGKQSLLRYSKNPVLGGRYFDWYASRYVEQGIVPRDGKYTFPDIRRKDGRPREFMMSRAALDHFCESLIRRWQARWGEHPLTRQHSDLIMDYMDRMAPRLAVDQYERRRFRRAPNVKIQDARPELELMEEPKHLFNERLNVFEAWAGSRRLFWSHDEWGNLTWTDAIRNAGATGKASSKPTSGSGKASGPVLTSEGYRRASRGA